MSLCILCPGQASQSPQMFARVRADPQLAASYATLAAGLDAELLAAAEDPLHCFDNRVAQPAICLYQLCVWRTLQQAAIVPAIVAGYSVGEVVAWSVAGALHAPDVLAVAQARAGAMDAQAPPDGGLLAVRGLRAGALEALALEHGVQVAIRNGHDHAVLAGSGAALQRLEQALQRSSAQVVRLPVQVPAHSAWLQRAVPVLRAYLDTLAWSPPCRPVLAGIDGQPRYRAADAAQVLSLQLGQTIEWAQVLDSAVEMGTTCFFELGPGDALCRIARARYPDIPARALQDFASAAGAVAWLQRIGA